VIGGLVIGGLVIGGLVIGGEKNLNIYGQ